MATKVALKLACFAVLACMLMISSPTVDAISCGEVDSYLSPCMSYLTNKGGTMPPPAACCNGVRDLNSAAQSTPDRKIACGCWIRGVTEIPGINFRYAASLPSECGVNIPYKISPSTDCSRVT